MTHSVFIDGAAGTTGLEIAERLAGRGEFELIILDDAHRKDAAARKDALHAADFAILCLHDDAAIAAVAMAEGARVRIIDASTAHRVTPGWTYGFPEVVGRDVVAGAPRIANPGCYPTGFIALIAPLVRAGLLPADWPYTVNAVSGYSGGGKALITRFEDDRDIAFRAYGLGMGHKHVPEMTRYAGLTHAPVFAPSVIACPASEYLMALDNKLKRICLMRTSSPSILPILAGHSNLTVRLYSRARSPMSDSTDFIMS